MYICVYIYIYIYACMYVCPVLRYNLRGFTETIVKRRALLIL